MHHPVSFHAFGGSASVEHEGLLEADALGTIGGVDRPVSPGRLPEPRSSDPVWTRTVPVFAVSGAVEVPLFLTGSCQFCFKKVDEPSQKNTA